MLAYEQCNLAAHQYNQERGGTVCNTLWTARASFAGLPLQSVSMACSCSPYLRSVKIQEQCQKVHKKLTFKLHREVRRSTTMGFARRADACAGSC